jgi:hypothetical protein
MSDDSTRDRYRDEDEALSRTVTFVSTLVALAVALAGSVAAIISPERGWAERFTSTHLVPR